MKTKQIATKRSSTKLISKVTEFYCITDDFCKEYELELNKKALSLSNPSPNTTKTRSRKGRMSDAEMITILVLFHCNALRNLKHFYLFYACRELKEEFRNLLSYTRFFGTYATSSGSAFALPDLKPNWVYNGLITDLGLT